MKDIDAEIKYDSSVTKEELESMEPVTRETLILSIHAIEKLEPTDEGVELNEGYSYNMDGSIAQIADGIAKMVIEMDKQEDMGHNAGQMFLSLISEFYQKLKEVN